VGQQRIPNNQLRSWRLASDMTRSQLADAINQSPTGQTRKLPCDDERIRRWEAGEVARPSADYRKALQEVSHRTPEELGFGQSSHTVIAASNALQTERELFNTMELARLLDGADIGVGTLDALEEATDLLCRAYPKTPSGKLKGRVKQRLQQVIELRGNRMTIDQHRRLLIVAGWMTALLGCVHYDLQEHEEAEAARQAAYLMAREADDPELLAWTYEMAAWFALVEKRFEDMLEAAGVGLQIKSTGSVGVQLHLQEAKAYSRLADTAGTNQAMVKAAEVLSKLPPPEHPDHHFVFDHSKWVHYAATIYTWLGDDRKAEEHATEVIKDHLRPDGSSRAPMRTAEARLSLATVQAHEGDLEGAVSLARSAYEFQTKPLSDLLVRGHDLSRLLAERFGDHPLTTEFREYLSNASTGLA
jgi:transcriptional regulator with XRE-family HTH domain